MSRILLLEDDLSLINGLSLAFKKQGFELDIARTMKEAGSVWPKGRYDLLVLMSLCPTAPALISAESCGRLPKSRLFFSLHRTRK